MGLKDVTGKYMDYSKLFVVNTVTSQKDNERKTQGIIIPRCGFWIIFDHILERNSLIHVTRETGKIECNDPAMALFKIDVYAASLVTYKILSRCSFKKDTR